MTGEATRLRSAFELRTKVRKELGDAEAAVDKALADARANGLSWLRIAREQARAAGTPARSGAALRRAILTLRQRLSRHGQRVTARHAKDAKKPAQPFQAAGSMCSGGSGHSPNYKEKNMAKLQKRIIEVYEPEPGDLDPNAEFYDDGDEVDDAANDDVEATPEREPKAPLRRQKK